MAKNITITKNTTGIELFNALSEGNPGAVAALTKVIEVAGDSTPIILAHLADMNIRGSQLAYAYQEVCGRDAQTLISKAEGRDVGMVDAVNDFFGEDIPDKAVTAGALKMDGLP